MRLQLYPTSKYLVLIILIVLGYPVQAQIKGIVKDASSNEPLSFISVFYEGTTLGTATVNNGRFSIARKAGQNELTFSAIGYKTQKVKLTQPNKLIEVKLQPDEFTLEEVVVKPSRQKYSRKNNPAVELMRKVIESKKHLELEENDYYQFDKYQKMKSSLNDLTEEKLSKGLYKNFNLNPENLEKSEISDNYILPISIQETNSKVVYRKKPRSKKEYVEGVRSVGLDQFISSGELLTTMIADVFTEVNIYKNEMRLLNRRFISPISDHAISFYKYFIMDTVKIEQKDYTHLTFVPQNSQDFGFTGHIYIATDSTYAVKRCRMNLPYHTGVNFVTGMNIVQEFDQLKDGSWILDKDIMTADMEAVNFVQGIQIERTTLYDNYSFEPIPEEKFKQQSSVIKLAEAGRRSQTYWDETRQEPLTQHEEDLGGSIEKVSKAPAFKYIIFVASLLFENHMETNRKGRPNKFDIGPVNTFISSNHIDGTRFRFGGRTTAALNPQWFLSGYGAYGLRDKRWKYAGELTYTFKPREFYPWEYPMHSMSFAYRNEVESPMDKFLDTDKDNVFVALKAFPVDQMLYVRQGSLSYNYENYGGLLVRVDATRRNEKAAGELQFIKNDGLKTVVEDFATSQIGINLRYAPGELYVNTKQRRKLVHKDVPVFTLSHVLGIKGFIASNYNTNITEASIWNRFWLSSWGKLDMKFKMGAQWNTVPFPLLIIPTANLSYTTQNNEAFNLLRNMEFFNDRYVALSLIYDMNGKLLNRIPLIHRLKWREIFKIKALYGNLTDKNNPYKSKNSELFLFPTRKGEVTSFVMKRNIPYIEATVGIYNIFKLLQIEYVRRLTYLDNPGATKHGIRIMLNMGF